MASRRHTKPRKRSEAKSAAPAASPIVVPVEQVMRSGSKCVVAYARTLNGKLRAKKWLDDLVGDAKMMSDKANLFEHTQILADTGKIWNTQHFEHEQGEFYAFKAAKLRLVCFQLQNVWYVTHGFDKDEKPWDREHFNRAKRIKAEQLQQLGIGS